MLRKNVATATRPLLANLTRRGISLESIADTPLAELVTSSTPVFTPEEVVELAASDSPSVAIIEAVSDTAEIDVAHDLLVEQLISVGVASVGATIDKARNVVVPAIASTIAKVNAKVDKSLYPDNDVCVIKLSPLATNSALVSTITRFDGASLNLSPLSYLPQLSDEMVTALLETGSTEGNQLLLDELAKHPTGYLNNVINDLIRGAMSSTEQYSSYIQYAQDNTAYVRRTTDALPAIVISCVILRNLVDNPPEGVSLPYNAWREAVTNLLSGLGATYHAILEDVATYVGSGQLYMPSTLRAGLSLPSNVFPILDRVYDAFLKQEGCPELLFALSLSSDTLRTSMATALENQSVLMDTWNRYVESYQRKATAELSNTVKTVICFELGEMMNGLNLDEMAVTKPDLWVAIQKYIDNLTVDKTNLYKVVRYLVAGVIYGRYQTLELLVAIDDYSEQYPDVSPRVAAYHGAKMYVCNWVLGQIKK